MSSYPEPLNSFASLSVASDKASAASGIKGKDGLKLEISSIADDIWCLEARYDEFDAGYRQPFTGKQEELSLNKSTTAEDADAILVTCDSSALSISKDTSRVEIDFSCGAKFLSEHQIFSRHSKAVSIYEKIESLKVTDFALRAPFSPKGEKFETQMVRFQYQMPETGPVLGLPGQTGEINRRGYRFQLFNMDQFMHLSSRLPMYQSWPIIFHRDHTSKHWIAIFHDNPSRTFVDLGDFYPNIATFEALSGNSRVYIMADSSLEGVSRKLSTLLGKPLFPPVWAFAYQQCRWSYMNSDEVREVKKQFDKHNIPLDAIYFDIDYMDGFRVFTKNRETFADLPELIDELKQDEVHSVCILDPGVKIDEEWEPYQKISATSSYLKNEDGTPYIGTVWPGKVIFPDFGDQKVARIWRELQNSWLKEHRFSGVWNDMNEPSNFDGGSYALLDKKTDRCHFKEEGNLYGYWMAKQSFLSCKDTISDRPFVISRSGYPGIQQYAVIWHGDNSAWWEHLRLMIDTCITYSLSGAYYTGADVPGFFESPPDDLAVRFFQAGSFLPLFRGHSWYFSKDKEPYVFGDKAREAIISSIRLRYSLLREWYSGYEYAHRTLTTPIKPVLENDNIVRDELLLFDKFLVAPVTERDQTRKLVYLPEGNWYKLGDTSQLIKGDSWQVVSTDLNSLPVYVKAGSILTRNTPALRSAATLKAESFEVYPDQDGDACGYYFDETEGAFSLNLELSSKKVQKSPLCSNDQR